MKRYDVKRKTAAFLAAMMATSNILGDCTMISAGAAMVSTPSSATYLEAESPSNASVPSGTTDLSGTQGQKESQTGARTEGEENSEALTGSLIFIEDYGHQIEDKSSLKLTVYRDGKLLESKKASIAIPEEDGETEEVVLASDSDAIRVTEWEYRVSGISEDDDGEHVYTVGGVSTSEYAVVCYDEDGKLTPAEKFTENSMPQALYVIPYTEISGRYRAVDTDGELLSRIPDTALSQWQEEALALDAGLEEKGYSEKLEKKVHKSLNLSNDIAGTWKVTNLLAFDPGTYDRFTYSVTLENNAEGFHAVYRNKEPGDEDTENDAAFDGGVIENVCETVVDWLIRVKLNWDDSENGMRPEDPYFVHVYKDDEELTDGATIEWETEEAEAEDGDDEEDETEREKTSVFVIRGLEEGNYDIMLDPVENYRMSKSSFTTVSMSETEGERKNPARVSVTMTEVEDIRGSIIWDDNENANGNRPGTAILSGLVSGADKVNDVDDMEELEDRHDPMESNEKSEVWVFADDDAWSFVVANARWDAAVGELTDERYTFTEEEAPMLYAAGRGAAREGRMINLLGEETGAEYKVTIENKCYSGIEESGTASKFIYRISLDSGDLPEMGMVFTVDPEEADGDVKRIYKNGYYEITIPENVSVTFDFGGTDYSGKKLKIEDITSEDGQHIILSASERVIELGEVNLDRTESFAYTETYDSYHLSFSWNDNADIDGDRPGIETFNAAVRLSCKIGGQWVELTADKLADILGTTETTAAEILSGVQPVFEDSGSRNHWTAVWNSGILPRYDRNGQVIEYAVTVLEEGDTRIPATASNALRSMRESYTDLKVIPLVITEDESNAGRYAKFDNPNMLVEMTHLWSFEATMVWYDESYPEVRPSVEYVKEHFTLFRKKGKDGEREYLSDDELLEKIAIEPVEGSENIWRIIIKDLVQYDENGDPYIYGLIQTADGEKPNPDGSNLEKLPLDPEACSAPEKAEVLKGEDVYYSGSCSNSNMQDEVSTESGVVYSGGFFLNRLSGETQYKFTKEWKDADRGDIARPTATYTVYRYTPGTKLVGGAEVDKTWRDIAVIPGEDSKPDSDKTISTVGDSTIKLSDSTTMYYDRFDEHGTEYVYFVTESLSDASAGLYESYVENADAYASFDDRGHMLAYDGATITNSLKGTVNKTIKKTWEAKAYQQIKADVLMRLTRYKKMIIDGSWNGDWVIDENFKSADSEQGILFKLGTFRAETMTFSKSFAEIISGAAPAEGASLSSEMYDEEGWLYRYEVEELGIINYNASDDPETPEDERFSEVSGTGRFVLDDEYPFVTETVIGTDSNATIINRLTNATDIKVQKQFEPALEPGLVKEGDEANDPLYVILPVYRETTGERELVGRVKYVFHSSDGEHITFDVYDANASRLIASGLDVKQNADYSEASWVISALCLPTATGEMGEYEPEKLKKFDENGALYRYTIGEDECHNPSVWDESEKYGPYDDVYSQESRRELDDGSYEKYGDKRLIATYINVKYGTGSEIKVDKKWLDGSDSAHRGEVLFAVQRFDTENSKWRFIDKHTLGFLDGGVTNIAEDALTGKLNEVNNWETRLVVSHETSINLNDYRVIELRIGDKEDGGVTYSKCTENLTGQFAFDIDNSLNREAFIDSDLDEMYGRNLTYAENAKDAGWSPRGIIRNGEHYYKTWVERHEDSREREVSFTICNQRIGEIKCEVRKTWSDLYALEKSGSHPSITVKVTRIEDNFSREIVLAPKAPEADGVIIYTCADSDDLKQFDKYDLYGEFYHYAITEIKIGDAVVQNGSATLTIGEGESAEQVIYGVSVSELPYQFGTNRHTGDTIGVSISNRLSETIDFTVYKLWNDDRDENRYNRPDIQMVLYRSSDGEHFEAMWDYVMDGTWTGTKTEKTEEDWTYEKQNYLWTYKMYGLQKYDSRGQKYTYKVQEVMSSSRYRTYYLEPNVKDKFDSATGNWGEYQSEFENIISTHSGNPEDGFAYDNAVVVNMLDEPTYYEGVKNFANAPSYLEPQDYPEIRLVLYQRYRYVNDDPWRPVLASGSNALTPEEERYLSTTLGRVWDETLNSGAGGWKLVQYYSFGKTTNAEGTIEYTLPRHDTNGRTLEYAVREVWINGEKIDVDSVFIPGNKEEVGDWTVVYNGTAVQNTYTPKRKGSYSVTKYWNVPSGYSGALPTVKVQLNRAMTRKTEGGETWILPYTAEFGIDNITYSYTYPDIIQISGLPIYGQNGEMYYYWVTEEKIPGYSTENPADEMIRDARDKSVLVKVSDIRAKEEGIKSGNFIQSGHGYLSGLSLLRESMGAETPGSDNAITIATGSNALRNNYPSIYETDYVTLKGEKKWSPKEDIYGTFWDKSRITFKVFRKDKTIADGGIPVWEDISETGLVTVSWTATSSHADWDLKFTYGNDGRGEVTEEEAYDEAHELIKFGLNKYAKNGNAYQYMLVEYYDGVPVGSGENFAFNIEANKPAGSDSKSELDVSVTNLLKTVKLTITKNWVGDYDNKYHTRPVPGGSGTDSGLTVYVQRKLATASDAEFVIMTDSNADPVRFKSFQVSGNTWTATIDNLPEYDSEGRKYEYRAYEVLTASNAEPSASGINGTRLDAFYEKTSETTTSPDGKNFATVTTNTRINDNYHYRAQKVWEDENNTDGLRPRWIELKLAQRLGASGQWKILNNSGVVLDLTSDAVKWEFLDSSGTQIYAEASVSNDKNAYTVTWYGISDKNESEQRFEYMAVETRYSYDNCTSSKDIQNWGTFDYGSDLEFNNNTNIIMHGPSSGKYEYYTGSDKENEGQPDSAILNHEGTLLSRLLNQDLCGESCKTYKITNSHTPIKVQVAVTKQWPTGTGGADRWDKNWGLRPADIHVGLYYYTGDDGLNVTSPVTYDAAKWQPVRTASDAAYVLTLTPESNSDDDWTGTFTDLPFARLKYTGEENALSERVPYQYAVWEVKQDSSGNWVPSSVIGYTAKTEITSPSGGKDGNYVGAGVVNPYPSDNKTTVGVKITNTPQYVTAKATKKWEGSGYTEYDIMPPEINVGLYYATYSNAVPEEHSDVYRKMPKDSWTNTVYQTAKIKVTSPGGSASASFTGLPKMTDSGAYISYRIFELDGSGNPLLPSNMMDGDKNPLYLENYGEFINEGGDSKVTYSHTSPGEGINEYVSVITNTLDIAGSAAVKKVWSDSDNQDGVRPGSLSVQLQASTDGGSTWSDFGGKNGKKKLDQNNNWIAQWDNLPKRNTEGKAYQYRIKEVMTGAAWETLYTRVGIKDINDSNQIKDPVNGITVVPTDLSGTPIGSGDWSGWREEDPIPDWRKASVQFTNTYTPRTIDITLYKSWAGDETTSSYTRPDKVSFKLMRKVGDTGAEEELYSVETASNAAPIAAWTGLPVASAGKKITYWIKEVPCDGYEFSQTVSVTGGVSVDGNQKITGVPGGALEQTATVNGVNTLVKTSRTVKKVWAGDDVWKDETRPESVTVRLKRKYNVAARDAAEAIWEVDQYYSDEVTINRTSTGWESHTWENLPIYIQVGNAAEKWAVKFVYYVEEVKVGNVDLDNSGYELTIDPETATDSTTSFTLTNTMKSNGSIEVTKKWDDDNNRDNLRPSEVEFWLLTATGSNAVAIPAAAPSEAYVRKITPGSDGVWSTARWDNLPEKDKNGDELHYYVYEVVPTDSVYASSWTENLSGELTPVRDSSGAAQTITDTVTNTYQPRVMTVKAEKIWDITSYGKMDDLIPEVTLTLQRNTAGGWEDVATDSTQPGYAGKIAGEESFTAGKILNSENDWKCEWTGLPVNELIGNAAVNIEYRVVETTVTGMSVMYQVGSGTAGTECEAITGHESDSTIKETTVKVTNKGDQVTWAVDKEFHGVKATAANALKPVYVQLQYKASDSDAAMSFRPVTDKDGKNLYLVLDKNKTGTEVLPNASGEAGDVAVTYGSWTATVEHLPKYQYIYNETEGRWEAQELIYRFVELKTDETGNLVLDADGNPISGPAYGFHHGAYNDPSAHKTTLINSDKIVLTGEKDWIDSSNKYGTRPETLTFTMYRGTVDGIVEATASNAKTPLVKYAAFTIGKPETAADGSAELPDADGFYTGTIAWESGIPIPDGVELKWKAEGNTWIYRITGLPKFTGTDAGTEDSMGSDRYVYSVEEETVPESYKRTVPEAEKAHKDSIDNCIYFGNTVIGQRFVNTLKTMKLVIEKKVEADSSFPTVGKTADFTFDIEFRKNDSEDWTLLTTIILADGEKAEIADFPIGYQYRIIEKMEDLKDPHPFTYTVKVSGGSREEITETVDGKTVITGIAAWGTAEESATASLFNAVIRFFVSLFTGNDGGDRQAEKTVTFTNKITVPTGKLTVKKALQGKHADSEDEFRFRVEFSNVATSSNAEFALTGGSSKTFEKLPLETSYRVTELSANTDGYVTTVPENAEGFITERGATVVVTYINKKEFTSKLTLRKTVTGSDDQKGAEYRFRIELSQENGEGQKDFYPVLKDNGTFTVESIKPGTDYTITELDVDPDCTVTVTEGALTGTISMNGEDIRVTVNNKWPEPSTPDKPGKPDSSDDSDDSDDNDKPSETPQETVPAETPPAEPAEPGDSGDSGTPGGPGLNVLPYSSEDQLGLNVLPLTGDRGFLGYLLGLVGALAAMAAAIFLFRRSGRGEDRKDGSGDGKKH